MQDGVLAEMETGANVSNPRSVRKMIQTKVILHESIIGMSQYIF